MNGKVKCTCGWSWNKSDSSKKDMYICHECGRDNSNNIPKAQEGTQTISSKDKRGIELLIKETKNAQKDKRELQTTGQIKNPKSIAYKSKVKKQPELKQDNKTDYEREYDREKGQAKEDKKQFKKNVVAPIDVATDIMQLGNFIPNPIAQTIGGIGNVAGMAIDAYQAYDDLSEGNYTDAAINAGSVLLPMGLDSKTFRRNSKYLKPGQPLYPLSPQANIAPGNINISRVNYIEPFTKVKGMTDTSLLANRALLGGLGAETIYDIPKQKNGGWLDNYNDSEVSLPEGFVGEGIFNGPKFDNPAWGGQFQMGGNLPGAVGNMYARTGSPSKGPRRNQTDVTDASAQNGKKFKLKDERENAITVQDNLSDRNTLGFNKPNAKKEIKSLQKDAKNSKIVVFAESPKDQPLADIYDFDIKVPKLKEIQNEYVKSKTEYDSIRNNDKGYLDLSKKLEDFENKYINATKKYGYTQAVNDQFYKSVNDARERLSNYEATTLSDKLAPYEKKQKNLEKKFYDKKINPIGIDSTFIKEAQNVKKFYDRTKPGTKVDIVPLYEDSKLMQDKLKGLTQFDKAAIFGHSGDMLGGIHNDSIAKYLQDSKVKNCYFGSCGFEAHIEDSNLGKLKDKTLNYRPSGNIWLGFNPAAKTFDEGMWSRQYKNYVSEDIPTNVVLPIKEGISHKIKKSQDGSELLNAQNGKEMQYYQNGLDFTPKSISKNGGWLDNYDEAQNGKKFKLKDERELAYKTAESTNVKKKNFDLEQSKSNKSYINQLAAQQKENKRRKALTQDQREREDYNARNEERGSIQAPVQESKWDRTKAIVSNPLTAFGYAARNESLPTRFQHGERNNLDYAIDWINPLQGIAAASEIPGELGRGEYLNAGLSLLDAADLGVYAKGAMKASKPLLQKGVQQLRNIPTSIAPELRQGLQTAGIAENLTSSLKSGVKKGGEFITDAMNKKIGPEFSRRILPDDIEPFAEDFGLMNKMVGFKKVGSTASPDVDNVLGYLNLHKRTNTVFNPATQLFENANPEWFKPGMIEVKKNMQGHQMQDALYQLGIDEAKKQGLKGVVSGEQLLSPAKTAKAHQRFEKEIFGSRTTDGIDHDIAGLTQHMNPNVVADFMEKYKSLPKHVQQRYSLKEYIQMSGKAMSDLASKELSLGTTAAILGVPIGGIAGTLGYSMYESDKEFDEMNALNERIQEETDKQRQEEANRLIQENKTQTTKYYEGGIIKDDRGQWDHPGEITEIGSNEITMEGVPYDVLGVSDTGDTKLMKPGKNYKFKGKKVTEYPMAKNGVNQQDQKTLQQLDQLTNFTNYNKPQPGGWLNKYN